MKRPDLTREVSKRLGKRAVVWAGIRGDDIEPLTDLPQLEASFSIIGEYRSRASIDSLAYESLTGIRVDLEKWDIDEHLETKATGLFRQGLLQALAQPSALLPYRPSRFLSAIWFARRDRSLNLGLFGAHQSLFEHKPWVETAVADLGIPHIPWIYVADEEQLRADELLAEGDVMLRRSRTSGGEGIVRVTDADELRAQWPHLDEAFVSVAPYISDALPLNIGAVVWDKAVTVHHPSIQLIGVPSCVTRPFGYCGNDFGLVREVDPRVLDEVESSTRMIGEWLRSYGFRGAFGVDFLVRGDEALFTEINPRFQGSTHSSCELDIEQSESCLMLEHVAAMLGMPAPAAGPQRPVREMVAEVPQFANLVVHWTGQRAARLDPSGLVAAVMRLPGSAARSDVLTEPSRLTEVGAAVARFTIRDRVTNTGFELAEPWLRLVGEWNAGAEPGGRAPVNDAEESGAEVSG